MAATILSQPVSGHSARIRETPLTGPIAWTRDTLAPEDGVLRLDPDCRGELDTALAAIRENPLPALMLEPAALELPACRALMSRAKNMLESGVGFVLIDRLPLDDYTPDEARALYWVLTQLLARPVAQSWDGKMIYDVRDLGRPPGNGVRPDITNAEQSFHTDNSYNLCPPDYVALLCLHPAMEGGISHIVSFYTAHNEMLARHPGLLRRLYQSRVLLRARADADHRQSPARPPAHGFPGFSRARAQAPSRAPVAAGLGAAVL